MGGSQGARGGSLHIIGHFTLHVHLLLTPATERGPATLMKGLGQRYVQYVNPHLPADRDAV
jgi:putative transposase